MYYKILSKDASASLSTLLIRQTVETKSENPFILRCLDYLSLLAIVYAILPTLWFQIE